MRGNTDSLSNFSKACSIPTLQQVLFDPVTPASWLFPTQDPPSLASRRFLWPSPSKALRRATDEKKAPIYISIFIGVLFCDSKELETSYAWLEYVNVMEYYYAIRNDKCDECKRCGKTDMNWCRGKSAGPRKQPLQQQCTKKRKKKIKSQRLKLQRTRTTAIPLQSWEAHKGRTMPVGRLL